MKTKIGKFAEEPLAFYLHKRRDFFPRLLLSTPGGENRSRSQLDRYGSLQ